MTLETHVSTKSYITQCKYPKNTMGNTATFSTSTPRPHVDEKMTNRIERKLTQAALCLEDFCSDEREAKGQHLGHNWLILLTSS